MKDRVGIQILVAIVLLALGIFLMANPAYALVQLLGLLSVLLIIAGVAMVVVYLVKRGKGDVQWGFLYSGIPAALLGIVVFAFREGIGVSMLPVAIGIAMLVMGLLRLFSALNIRKTEQKAWIPPFVGALISFVIGLAVITNLVQTTVIMSIFTGIYLLLLGLLMFVEMILSSQRRK